MKDNETTLKGYTPAGKAVRVQRNIYGNWNGYLAGVKTEFGLDEGQANRWFAAHTSPEPEAGAFRAATEAELMAYQGCDYRAEMPLIIDIAEYTYNDEGQDITLIGDAVIDDNCVEFHLLRAGDLEAEATWHYAGTRSATRAVAEALLKATNRQPKPEDFAGFGFTRIL